MDDRIVYGIGETGTWQTGSPTPHVILDGGVPSGVSIVKRFDEALSSGEVVTVTVRIDADNWSCYGYESGNTGTVGPEFTSGNPDILDFSAAHLLASKGTLSPGDPVEVWAELPEPDYAQGNLETHKGSGDHDGRYTMSAHSVGTLNGADGHVSAQNRVDWNTAYAWGDHALAGYSIAADQAVIDAAQDTAIANKFGSGDTVDHWFDQTQEGAAATYAATDGQTIVVTLTSSSTINLTTPVVAAGTAINFGLVIIPGSFTPTIQINGTAPDFAATLPAWVPGSAYSFNALVTNSQSFLMGGQELT